MRVFRISTLQKVSSLKSHNAEIKIHQNQFSFIFFGKMACEAMEVLYDKRENYYQEANKLVALEQVCETLNKTGREFMNSEFVLIAHTSSYTLVITRYVEK